MSSWSDFANPLPFLTETVKHEDRTYKTWMATVVPGWREINKIVANDRSYNKINIHFQPSSSNQKY